MLDLIFNTRELAKAAGFVGRLAEQQLPYATARTLTETVIAIRTEVRRQLPRRFTIRNRYLHNAIQMERANKRDGLARMQAVVGAADNSQYGTDFMARQEKGGIKSPFGKHIAVPTQSIKRRASGIIRKNQRPKALLEQKNHFLGLVFGKLGIWKRIKGHRLEKIYSLVPRSRVPQRWGFGQTAQATTSSTINRVWSNAIRDAMRTARM